MKVFFDTVGCRLNQAEIESMAAQLRAAGHVIIDTPQDADLVIVNSCTVTSEAASDSRQKVRQADRQGAKRIVVTGCLATTEPLQVSQLPGVSDVVPNQAKSHLLQHVLGNRFEGYNLPARSPIPGSHRRTRAFIKTQDGCDNYCTFCITRIARGRSISQGKDEVLELVQSAHAGGTKEVVLSGVNLGSWGKDLENGEHLGYLLRYLLENSKIERIRLSSLEPWDLDAEFFELWQDRRLCRHLHLPLQSGSTTVLKRMARNTTPEKFSTLVDLARTAIPDVCITTDIIVGFPGETEDEFKDSLDFVDQMNFSGGHIFRYSRRQGTAAARLTPTVTGNIAAERSRRMRTVLAKSAAVYIHSQVGKSFKVLWEKSIPITNSNWELRGLSDTYQKVRCISRENRYNQIDVVNITSVEKDELKGMLVEE